MIKMVWGLLFLFKCEKKYCERIEEREGSLNIMFSLGLALRKNMCGNWSSVNCIS